MTLKQVGFWLLDRLWATINTTEVYVPPREPEWQAGEDSEDVIETAYGVLKDALKEQDERMKTIDSKLQSISSIAPLIITIIFGIVAFLTGEKSTNFGSKGLMLIEIGGCYVALQFIRALLAAINGLSVRGFFSVLYNAAPPRKNETKPQYLLRVCRALSTAIHKNREVIDGKVDQLLLAHDSIKNAVSGIIIVLSIIIAITIQKSEYFIAGYSLLALALVVVMSILAIKYQSN